MKVSSNVSPPGPSGVLNVKDVVNNEQGMLCANPQSQVLACKTCIKARQELFDACDIRHLRTKALIALSIFDSCLVHMYGCVIVVLPSIEDRTACHLSQHADGSGTGSSTSIQTSAGLP